MFVTKFDIYGKGNPPGLLEDLYGGIVDIYNLPPVAMLRASVVNSVKWPDTSTNGLQVFYLENMIEEQRPLIFEIRFEGNAEAREHVSVFLSLYEGTIGNLSIQFPGRNGRGCFSRIMATMKSLAHTQRLDPKGLNFEIQGFPETGNARYIREHSLSAFVWSDLINRYLHTSEDESKLSEVKRGKINPNARGY